MTLLKLFNNSNSKNKHTVLVGEDDFLNEYIVDNLTKEAEQRNLEKVIIDCDSDGLDELIASLTEANLFANERLVIVKNPFFLTAKTPKKFEREVKQLSEIFSHVAELEDTIVMVASYEKLDRRKKLVKMVSANFNIVETKIKPYELLTIIKAFIANDGMQISERALQTLIDRSDQVMDVVLNNYLKLKNIAVDNAYIKCHKDTSALYAIKRIKIVNIRISPRKTHSLQFEQPALGFDSPAVAGQRTVAADDTVARHEYRHRICAVGIGNRPDCLGHTDAPRDPAVGDRLPERDFQQFVPHSLLELCAREQQRYVELPALSGKIPVELPRRLFGDRRRSLLEADMQHALQPPFHPGVMPFHQPVAKAEPAARRTEQQYAARRFIDHCRDNIFLLHTCLAHCQNTVLK